MCYPQVIIHNLTSIDKVSIEVKIIKYNNRGK